MTARFIGTEAQLRKCIAATGVKGAWKALGNQIQFRAFDGAVLNWWPSTKTINFQGGHREAFGLKQVLRLTAGELWLGATK